MAYPNCVFRRSLLVSELSERFSQSYRLLRQPRLTQFSELVVVLFCESLLYCA